MTSSQERELDAEAEAEQEREREIKREDATTSIFNSQNGHHQHADVDSHHDYVDDDKSTEMPKKRKNVGDEQQRGATTSTSSPSGSKRQKRLIEDFSDLSDYVEISREKEESIEDEFQVEELAAANFAPSYWDMSGTNSPPPSPTYKI